MKTASYFLSVFCPLKLFNDEARWERYATIFAPEAQEMKDIKSYKKAIKMA